MSTPNGNDREGALPPQAPEEQSRSFRLRAEHPRVTRLSRKVLAGGSAVALLVIGGAVLWSLQNNRSRNQAADELYSTDHHNVADGITALPKDYAGVARQAIPQLGPPLPGDLGRPILAAQGQLPVIGATAPDAEQQRRDQETGDDRRINSRLRWHAGGDGERHGQRQGHQTDGDTRDQVGEELATDILR